MVIRNYYSLGGTLPEKIKSANQEITDFNSGTKIYNSF